jgi:hypothetical protein
VGINLVTMFNCQLNQLVGLEQWGAGRIKEAPAGGGILSGSTSEANPFVKNSIHVSCHPKIVSNKSADISRKGKNPCPQMPLCEAESREA